jgi:hypothetical protein
MNTEAYLDGYLNKEALEIPIEEGDILLGGRFKNVRIKVKDIGVDELGQITINGKKLLNFRIVKTLPKKMQDKIEEK